MEENQTASLSLISNQSHLVIEIVILNINMKLVCIIAIEL